MTIRLVDMDDTACMKSPYSSPEFLALPLIEQHAACLKPEFRQALEDAPVAEWLEDLVGFTKFTYEDTFIIVTGRHDYQDPYTIEWCKKNLQFIPPIVHTAFNDAKTYVGEKVAVYKALVDLYRVLKPGEPIEIYEDNYKIVDALTGYFPHVTVNLVDEQGGAATFQERDEYAAEYQAENNIEDHGTPWNR